MVGKYSFFALYAILLFLSSLITTLDIPAPTTERSPLLERGENCEKICPCTYIHNEFDDVFKGEITLIQDENGGTHVFGLFREGFDDDCEYSFLIIDDYGNTLFDMTEYLNVKFVNGGTDPIYAKIDDLNLDCGENGITRIRSLSLRIIFGRSIFAGFSNL
ncbi:hypothetical protein C2G38_2255476 [Gigaspora rosea]|uniref:Uncharacterized protein n=1 Tax=Gigaspora rosea TaxID=44941 RepID=A0A397TXJ8_9GLOM|nr:hypothetical protein C2G38_2255476 [Gigaspora rosea]